jgi:hypothetical protein
MNVNGLEGIAEDNISNAVTLLPVRPVDAIDKPTVVSEFSLPPNHGTLSPRAQFQLSNPISLQSNPLSSRPDRNPHHQQPRPNLQRPCKHPPSGK